jgi:hypothetical protein
MIIQSAHLSRRRFVKSVSIGFGALLVPGGTSFGQVTQPVIPNAEALEKSFSDSASDIESYSRVMEELDRKPNVSRNEVAQFEQAADRARNAVSSFKRNLQELMQKAKAGGTWDQLDDILERNVRQFNIPPGQKTQFLGSVKRRGGAKSVLENELTQTDQIPNFINREVAAIKRKQTGLLFELISPAYGKPSQWLCDAIAGHALAFALMGCLACYVLHGGAAIGCEA